LVDTIFIKSHYSVYQFDNKGTTKGEASIFEIVFNPAENGYLVTQYYEDKYKRTFKPDTINIKKKDLSAKIEKKVKTTDLNFLFKALVENVDSNHLINQVDTVAFRAFVTGKQILRTAKRYKCNWYFKRNYSTKEENEAFFNACQSTDSLNVYLMSQFNEKGYVFVTDVSNTINIWISTTQSQYRFEGKYPNESKQPWYNHNPISVDNRTTVLNFQVNQSLIQLLPADFLLMNSISNEELFHNYITWYFERQKIKY
jgi:hypothetical protein